MASHLGGVAILPVASCNGSPDGPLGTQSLVYIPFIKNDNTISNHTATTRITLIYILGRKIKHLIPPLPPSGAPPVPLYNPLEIQLEKKDGLSPEEKNSSNEPGGNPFRKATNGRGY